MKMYRLTYFLLFQIVGILAHSHKIHEHMTPEEVHNVFGTNHENVPEYEIVPVSHTLHRSNNGNRIVQLTSFEEDITLYLEPTDGILAGTKTPVYRAKLDNSSPSQKVVFKKVSEAIKSSHKFYQDPLNLAALLVQIEKDGKALLNGIINKFGIHPLPLRFRKQFKREKRLTHNTLSHSDLEDTHHHIVYKIDSPTVLDNQNHPVSRASSNALPRRSNTNIIPSVIHPQVLVFMESTLFKKFNQNNEKAIEYLLSFWNGVDLRYRVFQDPQVRLNIAGVILAENEGVTPFITSNLIEIDGQENNKISVGDALRNMSQFFYPYTSYNQKDNSLLFTQLNLRYDVAVTMTTYDMCQFAPRCVDSGKYICSPRPKVIRDACITLGLAYYTGACSYDSEESLMESVSIIEDKGGFAGIIPAAHELGHLLGASHHPSNEHNCPVDDSYIMSFKLIVTENSFIWSNCSFYSINKFIKEEIQFQFRPLGRPLYAADSLYHLSTLRYFPLHPLKPRARCLFNKPDTGKERKRVLPGTLYSRDEMCQRIMGTQSCSRRKTSESCVKLYCAKPNGETDSCIQAPYSAIPEGAPCGNGHHCINARCVSKSERKVMLQLGTTTVKSVES